MIEELLNNKELIDELTQSVLIKCHNWFNDPKLYSWQNSDNLSGCLIPKPFDLNVWKNNTINDWLNEFTGDIEPTGLDQYSIKFPTYEELILDDLQNKIIEYTKITSNLDKNDLFIQSYHLAEIIVNMIRSYIITDL